MTNRKGIIMNSKTKSIVYTVISIILITLITIPLYFISMQTDEGTEDAIDSIVPMINWKNPEKEVIKQPPLRIVTNIRTTIGYDDEDIPLSIEKFPEFVNDLAGFDVYEHSIENPTKTHYYCGNEDDELKETICSTRFKKKFDDTWYDVLVDINQPEQGYTGKPVEISVLYIDNYN